MVGTDTRKILVAEDEEGLRQTLAEICGLEGHEVLAVEDGEAALAILQREPIDVLLLDLHLPRRDGVSLLQAIDPPPPVVIVYSAFEYYSPTEVAGLVGAKVFRSMRKPVPPAELLGAVSEAIAELGTLDLG